MLHEVLTYGTKWAHIANIHTPTRTTLALKNRHSTLRLKIKIKNKSKQSYFPDYIVRNKKDTPDESKASPQATGDWTSENHNVSGDGTPHNIVDVDDNDADYDHDDDYNDDDNEVKGDRAEEQSEHEIHAWLDNSNHSHHHHHHQQQQQQQQQHAIEIASSLVKAPVVNIQMPDSHYQSWDAWNQLTGLPTPAPTTQNTCSQLSPSEGSGVQADSYFQLHSPIMYSRPVHHIPHYPNNYVYVNEEPRSVNQTIPYTLYGKKFPPQT